MDCNQMTATAEEGRRAPFPTAENVAGGGRAAHRSTVHLVEAGGDRCAAALVARALALLPADLRCPPCAPVLARRLGVGEKRLASAFKAVLGRSMTDVLRAARLETARCAIETRDAPLKQIAWE